jgi:hypothetical protein
MTPPLLNRVARAICRAFYASIYPEGPLDDLVERNWRECIPEARAAIQAMREPTLEMVEAGQIKFCTKEQTRRLWAAMIDEALKE